MSARKPIHYRCKIHNYHGTSTPDNLLRGYGCPYCAGKILTKDNFINRVKSFNNDITLLSDFTTVHNYINCRCNKCGNEWNVLARHLLEGSGCPICNTSKGENLIAKYLSDKNIEFESHKKFKDLHGVGDGNLSYDFYIPTNNLLIEFQGSQHEKSFEYFGGEERFKKQKEHDKRKREYALSHSIDLLEIWYYDMDNIEQILNDKLSKAS